MIPIKLELQNFLPYREPAVLDFSGIHIACLSGDNGAGKSALLDAMTWVLWGKARARRDDELIHQGQSDMSVTFTFQLENNVYRVIRARKAGARGQSALDLQVQTPAGPFRSMAEANLRETQTKITSLLRLDYDTFINSAFLLQNRADEFTLKTPAQRKQVLSDILGLAQWETYEERTKARLKLIEDQIHFVDARLAEIDDEVTRRPAYEVELRAAQQAAIDAADWLRQVEGALHALQQAALELRNAQAQASDLEARLAQTQAELNRVENDRQAVRARLEAFQRALEQRDSIEAGYAALKDARAAYEAGSQKLAQLVQLNESKSQLEAAIADARRALETEVHLAAQAVNDLAARTGDLELETEMAERQAEVQAAQAAAEQAEAGRQRLAARMQDAAERRAQNTALKRDMDALMERITAIQSIQAACPTCGRPLDDRERTHLLEAWQAEGKTMGDTWRANKASIEQAAQQQRELEDAIAQAEAVARQLPALHRHIADLEARYLAAIEAASVIEDKRAALARQQQRLAERDYAHAQQAELASLLDELAGLGYDAGEHQHIKDTIASLAAFEQRQANLEKAESGIGESQTRLAALDEAEARWAGALASDRQRRAELESQVQTLHARLADAGQVQRQVDEARSKERVARERVGAAQQKLAACDALAKQKKKRLDERTKLAYDKGLYEELRLAFGKKGVPALIIEAAIPEIEDETNALLARITAGRMHVRFDTQRETLKGDVVETLDIKIADELGTRDYDNFSGGEQFRVNFAIRIAISKLLARRAGAQLQTLVLDEGFGALDASGRERLVEAINAIQADFARILVITHIDELRDVFPVRIEVAKTANGSQINIM